MKEINDFTSDSIKLLISKQEEGDNLEIEHINMSFSELFSLVDNLVDKLSQVSEIERNDILEDLKEIKIEEEV